MSLNFHALSQQSREALENELEEQDVDLFDLEENLSINALLREENIPRLPFVANPQKRLPHHG